MPLRILERILEDALSSSFCAKHLSIIYHAGEPLVAPISFYEHAWDYAERKSEQRIVLRHFLQTNGTLITQQWISFFQKTGFNVGLSLDGPQTLHDVNRTTRTGDGTFHRVMRGVHLLKSNNVPFTVIAVVSKSTLNQTRQFHDFFVDHKIPRIGLNVEEVEHANRSSSLEDINPCAYFDFLSELWDLCQESGLKVREFEFAKQVIFTQLKGDPQPIVDPLYSLTFSKHGEYTAFAPELLGAKSSSYGDFSLGNIMGAHHLDTAFATEKYQRIADDFFEGISQCRNTCDYFNVCGGGNASNKYFENGGLDSTETMYCRLHVKTMMDLVTRKLLNTEQVCGPL